MSTATQFPFDASGPPSFHGTIWPTFVDAVCEHQEYPAEQALSIRPDVHINFGGDLSTVIIGALFKD